MCQVAFRGRTGGPDGGGQTDGTGRMEPRGQSAGCAAPSAPGLMIVVVVVIVLSASVSVVVGTEPDCAGSAVPGCTVVG